MKQALCLCLLLFAAVDVLATEVGQQTNGYTVVSHPIDTTTPGRHHHKEPVVLADGNRIFAAWISFSSPNDPSSARIQVSTTTDLAQWQAPVTLSSTDGSGTGDPFFALNDDKVYLVGVGGHLEEILLWKEEDFTNPTPPPGTRICYRVYSDVDKPSITVSPSGEIYVAHLIGNNIHVHRFNKLDQKWYVLELSTNHLDASVQSPIVVVYQLPGTNVEGISVLFEDYKGTTKDRIVAWTSPVSGPGLWTSTEPEHPVLIDNPEFVSRPIGSLLLDNDSPMLTGATGTLEIPSMLMARYNAVTGKIGIVWHERKGGSSSGVGFVELNTDPEHKGFGTPTYIVEEGSQFHPAIESNPDGGYMVSYYDTPESSVNYNLKVVRISSDGELAAPVLIPDSSSTPAGYETEVGEYQDIRYSPESGSWYASFIRVTGTCSINPAASQCHGDTYVAKITPPSFSIDMPSPLDGCRPSRAPRYEAHQGARLVLTPTVRDGQHRDISDFSFEWRNGEQLIGVEPVLYFDVNAATTLGNKATLKVRVTSNSDGSWDEIPVDITMLTSTATGAANICTWCGKRRSVHKPVTPADSVPPNQEVILSIPPEAGETYAWYRSTETLVNQEFATGPTAVDYPAVDTTYQVTADDGVCVMGSEGLRVNVVQVGSGACPNAPTSGGVHRAVRADGCPSYSVEINPGESVTLSPPEGAQASSFEWEWYRSDQSVSSANFAHEKDAVVSPTVDTTYWVYNHYTVDGVVKEERSFNLYVLIRSATAPGIHLEPRFQAVPANAGAVIEVVDPAVTDGNYDGYKFEWFQGIDNTNAPSNATPLAWPYQRLPLELKDDVSFWCRVTKPGLNQVGIPTNVATVAVTCTDGLHGSIHASPGSYVSRTDQPVVFANTRGKWLRYDWFERLPEETTPRLLYKHTSSIDVTPAQPLTYYSARVQDACGQTAALAEIPVYLCVPTIDTQPADRIVPRGGSTSLTVAASPAIAGQPLTMTWRSAETGQAVGSGPTLNVTPAPGTTRTYYAEVSADCSGTPRSVSTRAATVTGCALAATAYSDRNLAFGQTATLSASISGAQVSPSEAEFTWSYGPAPGTEYASGVGLWAITPPPAQTTATYWVRVKDGTCTADSNPVTLRICVPTITSQPQGTLIRANQTANLSVGVLPLSNETFSYQWFAGAVGDVSHPVSGVTSNPGFTTPALAATTSYWVRVTSSCGATTDSAAAVVTVCNNPVISSVTPARSIRYGGSTWHQVYATGNNLTYQWYIGAPGNTSAPIQGATLSSISQSPATTTTYWARVSSYNLCTTDSAAMVIDVCTDPPITTQPASKTINSGQSATLAVATSATGATYQWYLGTGAAIQGATSSSLTVTPAADTQYFAQATRGACTSTSDTATVTVCTLAASLTGGANIALGQSATLSAGVSNSRAAYANYEWYAGTGANSLLIASGSGLGQKTVNPSVTTQYWVRVSDGTCTADSSPVTVSVCKPTITVQPQGTTVNSGQTATLSVTATAAPLSYQWYIGTAGNTTQPIPGATSASYTTPPMSATTSYWVRVTGCTTVDSVAATVNVCAPPAITSGPTADSQRIPGTIGKMTVTATGTGLTYQWFTGQSGDTTVPVAGSGCNTAQCSFTLSTSKYYWVRIIGTCGTLNSPAVIHPVSPTITQQPQSASVPPNATPTLSVAATGTNLTYQWYRGSTGNTAVPMSGATAPTFTVPPVTAPVSYWCRVTSVGNPTAIADSSEATLSLCTGPSIYGPFAQYLGYNQWMLSVGAFVEEDIGNFYCAWYTGVPGNAAQSVFQYEGGNYTNVTATGTQTWWCRAWYNDHSCYTDSGGATIHKVQ